MPSASRRHPSSRAGIGRLPTSSAPTQDFRSNVFFTPYRLVDAAFEVLWGRRENKDGSHGVAVRGQFALIYRFN